MGSTGIQKHEFGGKSLRRCESIRDRSMEY
jgi:hypothetical protein